MKLSRLSSKSKSLTQNVSVADGQHSNSSQENILRDNGADMYLGQFSYAITRTTDIDVTSSAFNQSHKMELQKAACAS